MMIQAFRNRLPAGSGHLLIIALLTAGLLWSCNEKTNPLALTNRRGVIVNDTLFATADSTYRLNHTLSTLASNRLLLGSFGGFTCRMIMRFNGFKEGVTVDSAWIRFVTLEETGPSPIPFTVTGYPINLSWIADTSAVWSDYNANVNFGVPMGEMTVTPARDDTLIFRFNAVGLERVNAWIDTSSGIGNNGMAFDFTSANFIKDFQARNSASNIGPFMFYQYQDANDSTITDSLLAISDAFLIDGSFQPAPGRAVVSTLDPWISVFAFDFDALNQKYPGGAIVESANLQLPIDWANSLRHRDISPGLQLTPLLSDISDANVEIDTSFISSLTRIVNLSTFNDDSSYVETTAGSDRIQLAQNYVERKLGSPDAFTGLYLEFRFQNEFLSHYSFFRYNSPDARQRPRLVLQLLKLPDEKFQ